MEPFDEEHAARYDATFAKLSPWAEALRLATRCALAELSEEARVLCVGAGTGAELAYLAEAFPRWHFTALDPSGPMLERCRARVEEAGISNRCRYHQGYLDTLVVDEPFDAATSLLVSQFVLDRSKRVEFFRQIRARVRPGAPLVTADLSTGSEPDPQRLLAIWQDAMRYADVPEPRGRRPDSGEREDLVSIVTTTDYAALLRASGWRAPTLLFQAVMIHGWVASAEDAGRVV